VRRQPGERGQTGQGILAALGHRRLDLADPDPRVDPVPQRVQLGDRYVRDHPDLDPLLRVEQCRQVGQGGGGQQQWSDQIGVPGGAVPSMRGDRLGQRGAAGRKDGGIVDQPGVEPGHLR
jgi:hypothetical protein